MKKTSIALGSHQDGLRAIPIQVWQPHGSESVVGLADHANE